MSKKKELAKNTIILMIGKISTQFVSFLLLPFYTKVLTTAEYGTVDLINTYITLLVPVITLQLESALFRFLIDKRNSVKGKTDVITNAFLCCGIQLIIAFIIFLIICLIIPIEYKGLIVANIIAVILSNIFLQISRGLGDNMGYAIGSSLAGISTVVLNVILLTVLKLGVQGMIFSTILANLLCAIFILIKDKIYKYVNIKNFSIEKSKELLKYSMPLVPNGLSWWIINASDRIIISHFLNVAANGIYAISNKFSGVFIGIYYIFDKSWSESAAINIDKKDASEFFTETINTILKMFSAVCIGIIAIMPFVFNIMINEQYAESYLYIPILMIGTLFNVLVGLISVVYIAKKITKEIAKTSVVAAILNIIINIILINKIGIYAAGISTVVSFFSMAIYRYIDVQKYVKIRISKKFIISLIAMFTIVIATYYINNIVGNVISLILTIIYSILINKKIIGNVIMIVKTKFIDKIL